MVRDRKFLQDFEREQLRSTPPDKERNFRILDALYEEARQLGIFPLKDPFDGFDHVVQIAKVVNSVSGTPR